MGPETSAVEDGVAVRFNNYCREISALEWKLANGGPDGKQAKRRFRLQDIRNRLLPQVIMFLS